MDQATRSIERGRVCVGGPFNIPGDTFRLCSDLYLLHLAIP